MQVHAINKFKGGKNPPFFRKKQKRSEPMGAIRTKIEFTKDAEEFINRALGIFGAIMLLTAAINYAGNRKSRKT